MPNNRVPFQTSTKRYQDRYYLGNVTQGMPYKIPGIISVPSGTTAPAPGMPAYWDQTKLIYRLPKTGTEALNAQGIICTRKYEVSKTYKNGDQIEILLQGLMVIQVGAAAPFWSRMQWQTDDQKWDPVDDPAFTALTEASWNAAARTEIKASADALAGDFYSLPMRVVDQDGAAADGDLIEISYGITR